MFCAPVWVAKQMNDTRAVCSYPWLKMAFMLRGKRRHAITCSWLEALCSIRKIHELTVLGLTKPLLLHFRIIWIALGLEKRRFYWNGGALIDCRYNGHANFNQWTWLTQTQSCSLIVLNLCFISRMRLPPYLPQRRDDRVGISDCQPPLRATLGHVHIPENMGLK